jgi:hypothetical protein
MTNLYEHPIISTYSAKKCRFEEILFEKDRNFDGVVVFRKT